MENNETTAYLAGIYNKMSEQVNLLKEKNEREKEERSDARFFRRFVLAWLLLGYYSGVASYAWILWQMKKKGLSIGLIVVAILLHVGVHLFASRDREE